MYSGRPRRRTTRCSTAPGTPRSSTPLCCGAIATKSAAFSVSNALRFRFRQGKLSSSETALSSSELCRGATVHGAAARSYTPLPPARSHAALPLRGVPRTPRFLCSRRRLGYRSRDSRRFLCSRSTAALLTLTLGVPPPSSSSSIKRRAATRLRNESPSGLFHLGVVRTLPFATFVRTICIQPSGNPTAGNGVDQPEPDFVLFRFLPSSGCTRTAAAAVATAGTDSTSPSS